MELLLFLEMVYIWRLKREHGTPKTEIISDVAEDTELPVASYPQGDTNADNHRYHPASRKSHSRSAECARCTLIS